MNPAAGQLSPPTAVQQCPACRQSFSGDAKFCPFDGEPLVATMGHLSDSDRLVGQVVDGRYEVESVLGQGGMGKVYAVRHRALDKRFALKVMRAELAREGDLAARFMQEARAAALVSHPNVVQITDFGETPTGSPYFVMELLDGDPLSKLLRDGRPPPPALSVRILQQAAAGLDAAHAAGVIHRDLKPDNIHVASGNAVKLLDFGVAKVAGAGRLTRTGIVFGTPHYMSPEQASGAAIDHRTDIYAFGIIMYEMFTGRVPFEADSYMGVLTKHMFMRPDPPSRVYEPARELGALEDVTLKCLEKDPALRYASMHELIEDMETIVQFDGDRLQIMRPSRRFSRRPSDAAAPVEQPGSSDHDFALEGAGLPKKFSTMSLVGAVLAMLVLAGGVFLLVSTRRAHRSVAGTPPGSNIEVAAGLVVAPASSAAIDAPPSFSAAAAPVPPPESGAPGGGPAPALSRSRSDNGVRAPSRKDIARGAAATAPRDGKRARPAPSFGAVDIVNPWER